MVAEPTTEHLGTLQDPLQFKRLAEVDASWRDSLDQLAKLARRILDVPLAQINVIVAQEQHSVSSVTGDPAFQSWAGPRSVPRKASYCRHVVEQGRPLVVENALENALVRANPATTEAGIRSYVGVPLKNEAGQTVATLCVVDFTAREWAPSQLEALAALADLLMRELRSRLEAEDRLQKGEARFQSLLENGADLITVLGPDGQIDYRSPAWQRILGYGKGEPKDTPFASLVHPADLARWEATFFQPLTQPDGRASGEWRLRHQDGSWRTVRGRGVNLLHDPAIRGFVLNMYDVTRKRQLEDELHQAQKMEAVGRLAGGVAHDFNNILTAIRSNADFLMDRSDLPHGAQADVREIQQAAGQATRITRQLLTFSRADPGASERFDLGELLEETLPLVRRLAGIDLEVRTHSENQLFLEGDRTRLSQVVMNLAVNACDAMPEGGTLDIRARTFTATEEHELSHSEMKAGDYAMLVVADDGVGMSRKVQRQVFEPFFSTKESGRGTGLGLSICWGIVKQMGGHIHLYSEPGLGTTFRIYLPLVTNSGNAEAPNEPEKKGTRAEGTETPASRSSSPSGAPSPLSSSRDPKQPATILLVEDQPEIRRVMRRALAASGYTLLEATNGEDALKLAMDHQEPIDLLLSDVQLPGMNGQQLGAKLSRHQPGLSILFTSGFSRRELDDRRVAVAPDGFLPKPFGSRELVEAVDRTLSRAPGE